MASDTSTVAYIFMRKYADGAITDAATRDHPFSRMAKKELGLTGEDFRYMVRYGNPAAVGGTFATTQGDTENSKGVQFATTPALKYGVITIHGPSMARAGSRGAKVDLVTHETDGVLEEMYDHLAFDVAHADGIRGRRSSASSNIITLTSVHDARNFKKGMTVGASSNADGSSPRTGDTKVDAVDEDNGTVTLVSAAAITSFADNDYLFVAGDPATTVDGLPEHFPLTAPVFGSDSFRGVDRGAHVTLLAGSRINNTSAPLEENIGLAMVKIGSKRRNEQGYKAFANPINVWTAIRRMGAKIEYDGGGGSATYGFEYINVASPMGTCRLYADPDFPVDLCYVGDMSTIVLKHSEPYVHIIRDDGKPSLRQATADGIEIRARSMANPIIYDPSRWCVIAV